MNVYKIIIAPLHVNVSNIFFMTKNYISLKVVGGAALFHIFTLFFMSSSKAAGRSYLFLHWVLCMSYLIEVYEEKHRHTDVL